MKKRPIGIFDSGVGGLTVFKEIRKQFPNEDIIYFGDTARVPYGPKSKKTVIEYSIQNTRFLIQQNAKLIVIACNTSSSVAIPKLKELFDIPIIGVINPGAESALKVSKNKIIGIIGTYGTIKSNSYNLALKELDNETTVFSQACPLFVSIAEEGWENHKATEIIADEYLNKLSEKNIDTIVLGCTHFPILKNTISKIVGKDVKLVDSAVAVSYKLKEFLKIKTNVIGKDFFYVSDNEEKFKEIANRILGYEISCLQKVKLGESWNFENETD